MRGRLKQMLVKEFLQLLRDPRMRIVIFGVPIIQMTIFAFALTTDVSQVRAAVLDLDRSKSSRELLSAFSANRYFELTLFIESATEISSLLDTGRVQVVIQVPMDFESNLLAGETAQIQMLADGTDSNTASIIYGYASQVIGTFSRKLLEDRLGNAAISIAQIRMQTRAWYNSNLESKYYYVPSLVAVMLLVITVILTSVAIVREKEAGTIEQVMVTPITRLEFILGKTIPYTIIGYIIMTLMLVIAMLVFDIRIAGSWLLLYVLTGVYILGNLGLALLISVTAHTQQQAVLTAFLLMMPAVLLSGFMFPIDNMPEPVQFITYLNPMRWYIEILRGVVIKGVGAAALWRAAVGQMLLAAAFISLAVVRFRKTMT